MPLGVEVEGYIRDPFQTRFSNPGRAFPLSFLGKWACGWVVAWDWEVGRLLQSHLAWR